MARRATRALISALTGGRPPIGRPESLGQCSRTRRRCHRRTVSGATITRAPRHPVHILDSQAHGELVVQREILKRELVVAAAEDREESKQVEQEGDH